MEINELLEIIMRNEDSTHQFKANMTNATALAQEMVAFCNSGGGSIFIGINDDGTFSGLGREDMGRLNSLVSNAASQHVRPPINPLTEDIAVPAGLVMRITVYDGVSKPYMDKDGVIWVKSGADKRKATSREEIQRLFQNAGLVHGDEVPVAGTTIADIDIDYFKRFYEIKFGITFDEQSMSLLSILHNMNLMKNSVLNVSGALLFMKSPQFKLPVFIVKAIVFPGVDIHQSNYIDSRDITGKLEDVFRHSVNFICENIRAVQRGQGVNSLGMPEIPFEALEEIVVNALIHRDYFVSAPIRIFIFDDRVEILSPGHLPNNLTVANIKSGNSNIRNPILTSFATRLLPYRGIGTGIIRALKVWPHIDFVDDRDNNLFKVVLKRILS